VLRPSLEPTPALTIANYVRELQKMCAGCAPPRLLLISDSLPYDELLWLYAATDVLVMPSRGEGCGRPLFEALAVGTPVVTTGWGGQCE
jgi:glycogen synthase